MLIGVVAAKGTLLKGASIRPKPYVGRFSTHRQRHDIAQVPKLRTRCSAATCHGLVCRLNVAPMPSPRYMRDHEGQGRRYFDGTGLHQFGAWPLAEPLAGEALDSASRRAG